MKCTDCGQYDALNWSSRGFCLRCWLKSDEPPVSNQALEIIPNEQPDFYDRCAECGRKFLARASFDNFYCDHCYLEGAYDAHTAADEGDDDEA